MDVTGRYIIVPKHWGSKKKSRRRSFHGEEEMELMVELATTYASQRNEDFLIVQVVREISKPKKTKP
jgi:hypothetical protein